MENRVLKFDNVRNFRDFGGYKGRDGRTVKAGVLYRSAQFGEASKADMARLDQLNIRVQADLRRPDERERHGHRWPIQGVDVLSSDLGRATEAPHVRFLSEVAVDADQSEQWMVDYYRDAPFKEQHVATFKGWFEALLKLKAGEAGVVNCAAGKDRTGILCALTHHALGVSEADIFEDYELTNTAADVEARLPEMSRLFNEHIGKDHHPDVYWPFIGVRKVFLENALQSIQTRSGSLDTYLTEVLGMDRRKRDQLAACFLD